MSVNFRNAEMELARRAARAPRELPATRRRSYGGWALGGKVRQTFATKKEIQ